VYLWVNVVHSSIFWFSQLRSISLCMSLLFIGVKSNVGERPMDRVFVTLYALMAWDPNSVIFIGVFLFLSYGGIAILGVMYYQE